MFYVPCGIGVEGCVIYFFSPEGRCLDLRKEDEEFEVYLREQDV